MKYSRASEMYSTHAEKKKFRKRFPANDVAVNVKPKYVNVLITLKESCMLKSTLKICFLFQQFVWIDLFLIFFFILHRNWANFDIQNISFKIKQRLIYL